MTREEAKDFLTDISYDLGTMRMEYLSVNDGEKVREAIETLEQEPTTKNDLGVDVVSRKEVINQIFYSTDNNGDVVLGSALRERIARLPSVTPQEPQDFKWCTDCREHDQEKHCCHRWSKVIRDTIEEMKQELRKGYLSIDDVMSVFDDFMCGEVDEDGTETFLKMLKDKVESEDKK